MIAAGMKRAAWVGVKKGAGSVRLPGNRESGPVPGNSGRAMVCLTDFIRLNMDEINMNPKNGTRGKILNGT